MYEKLKIDEKFDFVKLIGTSFVFFSVMIIIVSMTMITHLLYFI